MSAVVKLIAHCGTHAATRADVLALPTPAGQTPSHRTVPHGEVITEVLGELAGMGLVPAKESYSVSPDGDRLFGVIDTTDALMPQGVGIAIGIRNSHDKSLALGICAGTRVVVCDNLAFRGDVVRYRRHTSRIHAPTVIRGVLEQVVEAAHREAAWMYKLQEFDLTDRTAKGLLIDGLRQGACTTHQLRDVVGRYFDAPEDGASLYAPRTAWSLYGCFTEAYKDQRPELTLRRCQRLNRVFGQALLPHS
jgi:hypothetical protein